MQSTSTTRKTTLADQARAIALILEAELGSSVALYDAESGNEIPLNGTRAENWHGADFAPDFVRAHALRKRPVVMACDEKTYRVVLPIKEEGVTRIVGLATLPRFARDARETEQELPRLEKWCTLLLDKLSSTYERGKGQGDSRQRENQACSVISAFDILLRNARLHGESARFQRHALKAVTEVLGVETAIWIGGDTNAVVVTRGVGGLSSWECRQLAGALGEHPDWDRTGVLIDNSGDWSSLGIKSPQFSNVMAVRTLIDGAKGYVIVLNKVSHSGSRGGIDVESRSGNVETSCYETFQRSDAALLASFVTLMTAQARTSRRHQGLKDLVVGLTRSLTAAIDAKNAYTAGHSERVARMAVELGKEMGLPEEQLNDIYLAGLLHDIGKIGIRDDVLGKKERLTDDERDHINQHVVIGHRILSGLTAIEHLLGGVLYHHEQWDGKGYPEGLKEEEIPELARILAVADGFDAMSSDRPYRKGMSLERVEEIFRAGTGKQWDPVTMAAFWRCKDKLSEIRQIGIGDSLREALEGALRQGAPKDEGSLQFAMKKAPAPATVKTTMVAHLPEAQSSTPPKSS